MHSFGFEQGCKNFSVPSGAKKVWCILMEPSHSFREDILELGCGGFVGKLVLPNSLCVPILLGQHAIYILL